MKLSAPALQAVQIISRQYPQCLEEVRQIGDLFQKMAAKVAGAGSPAGPQAPPV